MFDFAWSEIALIGIVALVAIGPKDLPVAIKTVAQVMKKARRMAAEFQTHVDEMVREANLHELRDQVNDLRTMDIKGKILSAVDEDGSIRKTLSEPIELSAPPIPVHDAVPPPVAETDLALLPAHELPPPPPEPPPFVPPSYAQHVPSAPEQADPPAPAAPAFVPPAPAHSEHA